MDPVSVEEAVSGQLAVIRATTAGTKEPGSSEASSNLDDSGKLVFSSLALELGGGVSDNIKGKVWADEYVDLGILLSVSPSPDRYSISINTSTPSQGAQLTLEPCKPPKKITNINQWISAFNTFVAIYAVGFPLEAPLYSAIGYFTTSNFAFYGKLLLISILGMQCIGCYG